MGQGQGQRCRQRQEAGAGAGKGIRGTAATRGRRQIEMTNRSDSALRMTRMVGCVQRGKWRGQRGGGGVAGLSARHA